MLSDRLTIVTNSPDGHDDSLEEEVHHLRAQVEILTSQLEAERAARSPAQQLQQQDTDVVSVSQSDDVRDVGYAFVGRQGQSDAALYDLDPVHEGYFGRVLRPTFDTDPQTRIEAGDKSSAWSLWKDDHSAETPVNNPHHSQALDLASLVYNDQNLSLIEVFFDQRWPHLPLIHKPTFMRECFLPFSRGEKVSGLTRFRVLMVLAIASLERSKSDREALLPHRHYFDLAVRDLNNVMRASDLECIQCLLLLCMYGRTEPQAVNMWYTTGLALRIATGMDLHRAESIRRMSLLEAEMCKRLFWSIYAMDRSMSIYLGRPLGVQDADITLPFPLQLTDQDLEMHTSETVQPRIRPDVRDMSTFIHLLRLRKLNAEIHRVFHSTLPPLPDTELLTTRDELYSQLNDWLVTAPRYPYTSSMFQSPEWFSNAYHLAIIVMHRPSYSQPSPSISALQLCADSSISLISGYGSLYAKNKVSYSFVALAAIFMAAVTMLYSLRASPQVRRDLTKQVIETNIKTALMLLRGISNGREVAERAAKIVQGLGDAVLALFDHHTHNIEGSGNTNTNTNTSTSASGSDAAPAPAAPPQQEVDREFLSWFGLKSKVVKNPKPSAVDPHAPLSDQYHHSNNNNLSNNLSPGSNNNNNGGEMTNSIDEPLATLSVDMAWEDLFAQGFGMDTSVGMDFFPHSGF